MKFSFRKFLLITFLLGNGAGIAYSQDEQIYRSAYYLGRGDTGIAIADDQEAIFYNPAGLALGDGIYKRTILASPQVEISSDTRTMYNRLVVEEKSEVDTLKQQIGQPLHLSVQSLSAVVFRRAAIGALYSTDVNALVKKDPDYGGLETLTADYVANTGLTFSIAEGYFDNHFLLGVTGKYINRSEANFAANIIDSQSVQDLSEDEFLRTGVGQGFDLGLMYRTGLNKRRTEHSFGVTVKDVGDTSFSEDAGSEELNSIKQTINVGYAITLGTKVSRFHLLLDYWDVTGNHDSNPYKNMHVGAEINVADFMGLTGGLNQGYPCAGLFANLYVFRFDVGFYGEEKGEYVGLYADQRYFFRMQVGL